MKQRLSASLILVAIFSLTACGANSAAAYKEGFAAGREKRFMDQGDSIMECSDESDAVDGSYDEERAWYVGCKDGAWGNAANVPTPEDTGNGPLQVLGALAFFGAIFVYMTFKTPGKSIRERKSQFVGFLYMMGVLGMLSGVYAALSGEEQSVVRGLYAFWIAVLVLGRYLQVRWRLSADEAIDDIGAAAEAAQRKKVCPDCRKKVLRAARVCRFCGYRFDGDSGPEAPRGIFR